MIRNWQHWHFSLLIIVSFQEALAVILNELFTSITHELLLLHALELPFLISDMAFPVLLSIMDELFLFS
jgi:hypothetical protein